LSKKSGGSLVETRHKNNLTSAEIAHLWNTYVSDSMVICVLSSFLEHTQDVQIKEVIKHSLALSQTHVKEIRQIFEQEN